MTYPCTQKTYDLWANIQDAAIKGAIAFAAGKVRRATNWGKRVMVLRIRHSVEKMRLIPDQIKGSGCEYDPIKNTVEVFR